MPHQTFRAHLADWQEVHALPGSWQPEQLRRVLTLCEYDDAVGADELLDITLMVLQDLGPRHAAEVVLEAVFGKDMSPGIRQNIAEDLQEDRPWEEHTKVGQQAGIFEAVVLLQQAFPTRFGTPDAVMLELDAEAVDPAGAKRLEDDLPTLLLLRLLAAGMPEDAVLNRLYGDDMVTDGFPAGDILWRVDRSSRPPGKPSAHAFTIWSSWQWLGPLEDNDPWQGKA